MALREGTKVSAKVRDFTEGRNDHESDMNRIKRKQGDSINFKARFNDRRDSNNRTDSANKEWELQHVTCLSSPPLEMLKAWEPWLITFLSNPSL